MWGPTKHPFIRYFTQRPYSKTMIFKLRGHTWRYPSMIDGEEFGGLVVSSFKDHPVHPGLFPVLGKIGKHLFSGHVPGQLILGHGTAPKTLYGPIKTSTARLMGGSDLFLPPGRGGMQMRPEFDFGIFGDQIGKQVMYHLWGG